MERNNAITVMPIETVYNGHKFRSRLEARWAVFFDAAKIRYEYEPEGFINSDGERYLPDFYLPDFETYVEVKPDRPGAIDELYKAYNMIYWGSPIKRILILSNIPPAIDNEWDCGMWHFPCFYSFDAETYIGWWFFQDSGDDYGNNFVIGHVSHADYVGPFYMWDGKFVGKWNGVKGEHESPYLGPVSDARLRRFNNHTGKITNSEREYMYLYNQMTYDAFDRARKARFEHGENGK
jgi:hypothetical protein